MSTRLRSSLTGVGEAPAAVKAVAGVVLVALLAATVGVILAAYGGAFSDHVEVRARMTGTGNAIQPGDQVRYRDVVVGTVAGQVEVIGPGTSQVRLRLRPSAARTIPQNVTALVQPASIFGTQAVLLEQPTAPTGHLTDGAVVAAAPQEGSSLQTTFANLDQILDAVHPAQLATALGAIAQAVDGKGAAIGRGIATTSDYLAKLRPLLPTLGADIGLVATVAGQATVYVPNLLAATGSLTTIAATVTRQQADLAGLLTAGDAAVRTAQQVVTEDGAAYARVVTNLLPILSTIAARPGVATKTLAGLQQWTTAWNSAITPNRTLKATIYLPVPDPYDFVGAGSPVGTKAQADQAFKTFLNPATYTSADCPTYGSQGGRCAHALTPQQRQAIGTTMIGLTGRYDDGAPAVLLLAPLLAGAAS